LGHDHEKATANAVIISVGVNGLRNPVVQVSFNSFEGDFQCVYLANDRMLFNIAFARARDDVRKEVGPFALVGKIRPDFRVREIALLGDLLLEIGECAVSD
jgi:hypothetical protein